MTTNQKKLVAAQFIADVDSLILFGKTFSYEFIQYFLDTEEIEKHFSVEDLNKINSNTLFSKLRSSYSVELTLTSSDKLLVVYSCCHNYVVNKVLKY
jgi:hypothetical protein